MLVAAMRLLELEDLQGAKPLDCKERSERKHLAFRQMKVLQLLKGEWLLQMKIIILLYGSIQLK